MSEIIVATDSNFQDVVKEQGKNGKHVVVDFWAEWCGPCKALSPVLDQLAKTRDDIVIVKVNADDNQMVPARYGIRGLPSLVLLSPESEELATLVGASPLGKINAWIDGNMI